MSKNTIITVLIGIVFVLLFIVMQGQRGTSLKSFESQKSNEGIETQPQLQTPQKPKSANSLDLSGQGLNKLPAYVLSNTSLEELYIQNNNLTGALPAEIRHLKNLKILNASNNKMTGVPAEMGQLANLEVLNLSNNQLTGLPYELGNLKKLKILNLSGNNYAKQDLEIIKQGLSPDTQIIL